MLDFIFQMPRKTEIGFSKSRDMAKIIKEIELQRVLVVVDCNLKKLGIIDQMFNNLKKENISFTVFDR